MPNLEIAGFKFQLQMEAERRGRGGWVCLCLLRERLSIGRGEEESRGEKKWLSIMEGDFGKRGKVRERRRRKLKWCTNDGS